MSQIEVDKIIPQSGTALQVGENGDTITVPAGTTLNLTNGTVTYPNGSVQNVTCKLFYYNKRIRCIFRWICYDW